MERTIGPVTGITAGATAITGIACWALNAFGHVDIPVEVQGMFTTVIVLIAGWAVSPKLALQRAIAEVYSEQENTTAEASNEHE